MANTVDLKSTDASLVGSNPTTPTNLFGVDMGQDCVLFINQKAVELRQEIDRLCSMNDNWVPQPQAAKLLGISRARVSKMAVDGLLRSAIGMYTRYILRADIDARIEYIKKHGKPTRGRAKNDL